MLCFLKKILKKHNSEIDKIISEINDLIIEYIQKNLNNAPKSKRYLLDKTRLLEFFSIKTKK